MATQTVVYLAYEGSGVLFEEDYDDQTLRVLAVRCVNGTGQWAFARATAGELAARNRGVTYTQWFPPNQTTHLAVPTAPAQRLVRTLDRRDRLDGLDLELIWPATPPG